jgi:hypothetical protein
MSEPEQPPFTRLPGADEILAYLEYGEIAQFKE